MTQLTRDEVTLIGGTVWREWVKGVPEGEFDSPAQVARLDRMVDLALSEAASRKSQSR